MKYYKQMKDGGRREQIYTYVPGFAYIGYDCWTMVMFV